jgi:hypothetical protein
MKNQLQNSYIKLSIKDKMVFGGEIERKRGYLNWKIETSDFHSIEKFRTKDLEVFLLGKTEIHINTYSIKGRTIFINKGVEKVDDNFLICQIELINKDRIKSNTKRFSNLKTQAQKLKIAKAISKMYQEESEEIDSFTKSAEKLISAKTKHTLKKG